MKRGYMDFLRLAQFPLILAMGLMPVPMLIFSYLRPEFQRDAWLFSASYFLLTCLGFLIPGKLRLMYGIIVAVAAVLPWPFVKQGEALVVVLMITCLYAAVFLWSLRIAAWKKDQELHSAWLGACLLIQIAAQIVLFLDGYTPERLLKPLSFWLYFSFLVTVILCMLCMNRMGLNRIASDRSRMVVSMRFKNAALLLGMILLAALCALIPSVFGLLTAVAKWISGVTQSLFPEKTEPTVTRPVVTDPTGGLRLDWNVGVHTEILNMLFIGVFILALVVLIPLFLIRCGKLIGNFFRNIWGVLLTNAISATEDYEDEITDTRDSVIGDETEKTRRKQIGLFYNDRGLSNTHKVRHRYRYLLGRNPQWHKGTTARENLPQELASIYERARYSTHEITTEEASQFKTETKNL